MKLYAYASGELDIGKSLPEGALLVAEGKRRELELIQQRGRLAYDGETWLVPGIPEAENQRQGIEALQRFMAWAVRNAA